MKYTPAKQAQKITKEDYTKHILFGSEEFEDDGHLLQVVEIPPKTKQREHFHRKQTEVFYILEGKASIFFNDMEFVAHPGDGFICEKEDRHYLHNKSDKPFKLAVFKINKPKNDDDTVWIS